MLLWLDNKSESRETYWEVSTVISARHDVSLTIIAVEWWSGKFWIIRQVKLTGLAGRLGVMYENERSLWISDRVPRRLELPSAEIRKTIDGAGLEAMTGSSIWDTEMCVRHPSQEVIYCSWIYESEFKRGVQAGVINLEVFSLKFNF